jgi:hypothetical protein
MAELKTKKTEKSVEDFLSSVPAEDVRDDCFALVKLMTKVTGEKPRMWGPGIVGFGQYHYRYDSGHEGDMCLAGFSPRKQNITVYVTPGTDAVMEKLGKHKAGKGCIYIKRLQDIDTKTLATLIERSVASLKKQYPG